MTLHQILLTIALIATLIGGTGLALIVWLIGQEAKADQIDQLWKTRT